MSFVTVLCLIRENVYGRPCTPYHLLGRYERVALAPWNGTVLKNWNLKCLLTNPKRSLLCTADGFITPPPHLPAQTPHKQIHEILGTTNPTGCHWCLNISYLILDYPPPPLRVKLKLWADIFIGVGRGGGGGGGQGGQAPPIIWEGGQHTLWPPQ